jgi:hypothetical protein
LVAERTTVRTGSGHGSGSSAASLSTDSAGMVLDPQCENLAMNLVTNKTWSNSLLVHSRQVLALINWMTVYYWAVEG